MLLPISTEDRVTVTRYHSRFDRQLRIMQATRRLLQELVTQSDKALTPEHKPRSPEVQAQYDAARNLIRRIDRELKVNGNTLRR